MKKIFLITLATALMASNLNAQGGRSTICVNAGYSLIGALFTAVSTTGGMPVAAQVTYDFSPLKWISIGVAGSYQTLKAGYNNFYIDGDPYSFDANFSRLNLAGRLLFHYGPKRVLMYSGLRLGTTIWKSSITSGNVPVGYDPMELLNGGGSFVPQLIPFGIQGFITKNIGLNMEIGIGSPHVVSGGVCIRL